MLKKGKAHIFPAEESHRLVRNITHTKLISTVQNTLTDTTQKEYETKTARVRIFYK